MGMIILEKKKTLEIKRDVKKCMESNSKT